jgi:hypothetical protein
MVRLLKPDRQRPRNYTSRREQLKLLALFVPLALVILAMTRLRHPKTAAAINAFFSPPQEQEGVSIKPRPPVAESGRQTDAAPKLFPGIDPNQLKTIEDNTYFRKGEKDAWFHFIGLLKDKPVDVANAAAVDYVQLVDQPDVYRGKLVTVRGTARQISAEKPAANDLGITLYYRVVIQPDDGTNWPIIVYCLELPDGMAPNFDVNAPVSVTGLFFKKLSYKWQDGLGIAPVILANSLERTDGEVAITAANVRDHGDRNVTNDASPTEPKPDSLTTTDGESPENGQATFKKILELSGWNNERLAKFDEGSSLTEAQRVEALELLRRLRTIDTRSLTEWRRYLPLRFELKKPEEVRGQLRCLVGTVTKVTRRTLDATNAERLEMPEYFECEFKAKNLTGSITILTARVPNDWLKAGPLKDATFANAVFVKQVTDETPPRTIWLAKEIAWFPFAAEIKASASDGLSFDEILSDPLLGKSLLGSVAIDVGQLDQVQSRGKIRPQERDIFYDLLSKVRNIEVADLVRIANNNLPLVEKQWRVEIQGNDDARRRALALEVVRRADQGRYSVAMLFNDPEPQIGRLFVFDGLARRAIRVEVPKDVAEHYLFDHYYELEVFTDDSQNYPIIFCAHELPKDFPVGSNIHVPVRVAGFFFKNWLYNTTGRPQEAEAMGDGPAGSRAQFAPLLIGNSPIVLQTQQNAPLAGSYVLGGLFVLALVGIWGAAVWFARDDRKFRERTPSAKYELPPGQSLNDLNLSAVEVPMTLDSHSPPET